MRRLRKADHKRLEALAERMIAEASSSKSPRILSSNGFSRSSISILHQQMRCTNLAWALKFTGRIKTGDVIGIVGGSFSGLMLASTLAMSNDVIVYIFEKEGRLMQRFLDKSHRFIAPNLNSRSLDAAFHPTLGGQFYDPPLFKWEGDAASTVAVDWRNEFKTLVAKLPVFCFLGREVTAQHITATQRSVTIQFDPLENGMAVRPIKLHWMIDATGFGPESNPFKLDDYSYWESGHRLIYDYLKPKARVLVSGCGDSGVIEVMHYALREFSHARVAEFWPSAPHLDINIDECLESAAFEDVTNWQDDEDIEVLSLISELRWFRGVCRRGAEGYFGGPNDLNCARRRLFFAIEAVLLKTCFKKRARRGDWQSYFDLAPQASAEVQAKVREKTALILDEESSYAIRDVMQAIDLREIFDMDALHKLRRTNIEVVLNGVTPTPFTRQLSPFNVWLMHVMLSFPDVTYRQGRLTKVVKRPDGKFLVRFKDGRQETFDRVVTRYGPGGASRLIQPRSTLEPAGYLLVPPRVMMNGDVRRYVDLAKQEVEQARQRLTKRRVSRAPQHQIEKIYFAKAVEVPRRLWTNPSRHRTQAALVQMLKDHVRPNFSQSRPW